MSTRVGELIRKARETKGLSQVDLARRLGFKSAQTISNIERGVAPLPKSKIVKFSKVLALSEIKVVDVILEDTRAKYLKALKKR